MFDRNRSTASMPIEGVLFRASGMVDGVLTFGNRQGV
jgi:hypothetical protein